MKQSRHSAFQTSSTNRINTERLSVTIRIILSILSFTLTFSQDWHQVGSDLNGEIAIGYPGYSISMGANGKVLVLGAPFTVH